MRKSSYKLFILPFLMAGLLIGSACCAKRTPAPVVAPRAEAPPPPPPPPVPAPTVTISASPSTITRGQTSTLTWSSTNASSVTIDGGVGTMGASGTRAISPSDSITYTASVSNASGSSSASTRVTVTEPAAPPPPPPPITVTEFFNTRIRDIYFDFDKYDIRPDAQTTLEANARALAERSEIRFLIEGHCDERGSEKYNLALGDRRANATKDYLSAQGVAASRMDTISYGEERPFAQGSAEEAWAQNRRAHFVLKP